MRNEIVEVFGLGFGDEGKGNLINYITHENQGKVFWKYCGGCQGRHTIRLDNGKWFSFSQLSPALLFNDNTLFIGPEFVFEPFALLNELTELSKVTGVPKEEYLKRIFIHPDTICATPIHKFFNMAEEEAMGASGRGSVGTGVSIAKYYSDDSRLKDMKLRRPVVLTAKMIHKPTTVISVIENQISMFQKICKQKGYDDFKMIHEFNQFMYAADLKSLLYENRINISEVDTSSNVVIENSQGVLIDGTVGIKPNTTYLRTFSPIEGHKIGAIRSLCTRHGRGVFPTEDSFLNGTFIDSSQEVGRYSGKQRFGWFDCVLYRYAIGISHPNEIYMSCVDYLRSLDSVKVCTSYLYKGEITEEFKNIFRYSLEGGNVMVHDILANPKSLKDYLDLCEPVYEEITLRGKTFSELISSYVGFINSQASVPIKIISYGNSIDLIERL